VLIGHSSQMRSAPPNRYAQWLVGVALVLAILAAVWLSKAESGGVTIYLVIGVLTAGPLLARDAAQFQRICRLVALLYVVAGLIGVWWGLPAFWPAAALLVLASHVAYGYERIHRTFVAAGALFGVIAFGVWGFAIYETALRPGDAFVVVFASDQAAKTSGFDTNDVATIGEGATKISHSGSTWLVHFQGDLTADERSLLQQRILDVSGASKVRLCSRWNGEC
jgi:hypothetical protein